MHLHSLTQDLVAHAPDCPGPSRARANRVLSLPNGGKPPITMSTQGHASISCGPGLWVQWSDDESSTGLRNLCPSGSQHLAMCNLHLHLESHPFGISALHYSALLFLPQALPASHSRVSSLCSPFVGTKARTCNPGSRARPRAWTGVERPVEAPLLGRLCLGITSMVWINECVNLSCLTLEWPTFGVFLTLDDSCL